MPAPAEVLAEIRKELQSAPLTSANEALTRVAVVDRILAEVLGWPRTQFAPEAFAIDGSEKQWLDYHLSTPDGAQLVVEAKRFGKTFQFGAAKRNRNYRLQVLKTGHGSALAAAINQASRYCSITGTFLFIVTNGRQWIASVAMWPQVAADKIEACVFHDLDDIAANLDEFIDLLSPDAVSRGVIATRALQGRGLATTFAATLNSKLRPSPPKERNYLARPIESLMRYSFDELNPADVEMVERCYVKNELTDGYVARLATFVGHTLPFELQSSATPVDRTTFAKNLKTDALTQALASDGEALLLVGRLGSGKSSFAIYAIEKLREMFGSQWVLLRADLAPRTQVTASRFDHDTFRREICEELLIEAQKHYPDVDPFEHDVLRGIFSAEVQRELQAFPKELRSSDEAVAAARATVQQSKQDPHRHLLRYTRYLLANRERNVTIVLDNVDRGTPEFEKAIFTLARHISRDGGATTLTPMRETTYAAETRKGFLDVSQNFIFSIAAPPFASVISRRLEFTRSRLEQDVKLGTKIRRSLQGYTMDTVRGFVEVMSEVVAGGNREIRDCIQALTGTDVRRGLEVLRDFFTSPNTDIEQLMKDFNRGHFRQPLAMFLRSMMRGDRSRYVESQSRIFNLFQVSSDRIESHFTAVRVLQFLKALADDPRGETDTTLGAVIRTLGGHTPTSVMRVMNRMAQFGLLASRSDPEPPWSEQTVVRIAGSGVYYLENMVFEREYMENIIDDTVIYDADLFQSLLDAHEDGTSGWPQRIDNKLRIFLRYLLTREKIEISAIGPSLRPWHAELMPRIAESFFGVQYLMELMRVPTRPSHPRRR